MVEFQGSNPTWPISRMLQKRNQSFPHMETLETKKHFDRDKLMQKMQPGTVGVIRYNSKREIILQRVLSVI